jgi:hypothetical protein
MPDTLRIETSPFSTAGSHGDRRRAIRSADVPGTVALPPWSRA